MLSLSADNDAKNKKKDEELRTKLEAFMLVLIELGIVDEINGLCIRLCMYLFESSTVAIHLNIFLLHMPRMTKP